VISTEARGCQVLIRQLKAKHKQIALQWRAAHCQIAGNEHANALAKKGAKITQTRIRETSYRYINYVRLKQVFQSVYRHELEQSYPKNNGSKEFPRYQTGQEERQLQNFDCALVMIAWAHIFTVLESTPTPTACYAAI
jgi:hypothetical protein